MKSFFRRGGRRLGGGEGGFTACLQKRAIFFRRGRGVEAWDVTGWRGLWIRIGDYGIMLRVRELGVGGEG